MADPWESLKDLDSILSRPQEKWSSTERALVWERTAEPPIRPSLYKYVNRAVRNGTGAEEVVQACLVDICTRPTYSGGNGWRAFKKWIFGCLYRHLCDYLRCDVYPSHNLRPIPSESALDSRFVFTTHDGLRLDLERVLDALDTREREVIVRSLVHREALADIAVALNLKPNNVRVIKFRALRELRRNLAPYASRRAGES